MTDREKLHIIECLLFTTASPLKVDEITQVTSWHVDEVRRLLDELVDHYNTRGIRIRRVADGYQMVTIPHAATFIEKLHHQQIAQSLTKASLEVLAIVAYRQPITRAEIEHLRGVKVGGVLANLRKKRLVQMVGRAYLPGRPPLYGTTREFLIHFGLDNLSELPPLPEVDEISARQTTLFPLPGETTALPVDGTV
ncbi:MAG: SMC-Scp complex subunit ScpB [Candidatus Eremiobacteraeota bacterium]|nr:SMC-Scp complex subunit ScpB [Candidatus Eremiobacteraeota bacterium]